MKIEPAHVNQVMAAGDGFVEISADVGGVAADLHRIDPTLKVRFQPFCENPFFAVYCQPDERSTYLVLTVKAHQGSTGVWMGLDQRVVREVERIGADGYDFASEVAAQNAAATRARRDKAQAKLAETNEAGWKRLNEVRGRNCGFMAVPGAVSSSL